MAVDISLKAKKLELVRIFLDGINLNKALGNDKLAKFLKDNYEVFVRGMLATINTELKSGSAENIREILNNQKKKLLSSFMNIRYLLESQTPQEMNEQYSKIIENLDALKSLIENE